jgi:hypothetical protein
MMYGAFRVIFFIICFYVIYDFAFRVATQGKQGFEAVTSLIDSGWRGFERLGESIRQYAQEDRRVNWTIEQGQEAIQYLGKAYRWIACQVGWCDQSIEPVVEIHYMCDGDCALQDSKPTFECLIPPTRVLGSCNSTTSLESLKSVCCSAGVEWLAVWDATTGVLQFNCQGTRCDNADWESYHDARVRISECWDVCLREGAQPCNC